MYESETRVPPPSLELMAIFDTFWGLDVTYGSAFGQNGRGKPSNHTK